MSVAASRVKAMFDTDASITLRAVSAGAVTSTTTETAIDLKELRGAYWNDRYTGTATGELPFTILQVEIDITACDAADGNETYTISLQTDDTADESDSPVTVWSQAVQRGFTGVLYAYVDSRNIRQLDTDGSGTGHWLAIKATLGGTTPSVTYGARIVQNIVS